VHPAGETSLEHPNRQGEQAPEARGGGRGPAARPLHANRRRGCVRREAAAILAVSSSEGRTPRARPVETYRGGRAGSNASRRAGTAGTQHDPGGGIPGDGGSARHGCAEGEGNLGRAMRGHPLRRAARGRPGETLERGRSLREASNGVTASPTPFAQIPRGGRTAGRVHGTHDVQGERGASGRQVDRRRG
jgi:hypothetical protein